MPQKKKSEWDKLKAQSDNTFSSRASQNSKLNQEFTNKSDSLKNEERKAKHNRMSGLSRSMSSSEIAQQYERLTSSSHDKADSARKVARKIEDRIGLSNRVKKSK